MTDEQKKWYRVNLSITAAEMRLLWKIGVQLMERTETAPPSIGRLIRLCIIESARARGLDTDKE